MGGFSKLKAGNRSGVANRGTPVLDEDEVILGEEEINQENRKGEERQYEKKDEEDNRKEEGKSARTLQIGRQQEASCLSIL